MLRKIQSSLSCSDSFFISPASHEVIISAKQLRATMSIIKMHNLFYLIDFIKKIAWKDEQFSMDESFSYYHHKCGVDQPWSPWKSGYGCCAESCLKVMVIIDSLGDSSPQESMENWVDEKRIRREIANSNERRRMQSINSGFQALRTLLPQGEGEKLSKVCCWSDLLVENLFNDFHFNCRLPSCNKRPSTSTN